jgi:hypothetical protein
MGFSFRKSFKAGPIRIYISKSGIGASFGVKGARISTGPRGAHLNVGAKGVYYRQKIGGTPAPHPQAPDRQYPALYPSNVNLENCLRLRPEHGYYDVVMLLGWPEYQVTKGPLEAKIPNTILTYPGKGAVFLIYSKDSSMKLESASYLGTVAFHPPRVLHTTIEEARPMLEAYAREQEAAQPPAYETAGLATPLPKKRRWLIYVGALVVLGAIGNLIEKPKPTYTPSYQSPVAEAPPSPTSSPVQRSAKQNKSPKASRTARPVSNQSTDPVIISQAPETSASPEAQPHQARSLSAPPASDTYSTRSSSRRSSAGRTYILGPRGGCYYISGSGSKVYVDHSYCY